MAEIEKSVLVEYSASQMFALVDDVAKYPEFLPWCGGTSVDPQDEVTTHATVKIDYHHIQHSFTTKNKRFPPDLIEMSLLDGPFEHLDGYWQFIPLSDSACKIKFRLHYTFSHRILEKLVGPVFHMIANSFVEHFIERAEVILRQALTAPMQIEIAYALPQVQFLKKLDVSPGCTVEHAIRCSGVLDEFPEIDLTKNKLGIFGKLTQLQAVLKPHDRIEIYRPLIIDPKEARRLRAKKNNR